MPIAASVGGGIVAVLLVVPVSLALAVWLVRNRRSKHGMWVYTVSTSTVNHSVSDIQTKGRNQRILREFFYSPSEVLC